MKTQKYVSIQSNHCVAVRSLNGNAKICVNPSYMALKEIGTIYIYKQCSLLIHSLDMK